MIPNASPETPPVRPSRAAAIQIQATVASSGLAAPGSGAPLRRPVGPAPYQPADPDMRSAQGLAAAQAVAARPEGAGQETVESRRANVRAHVTRRLTALQGMDASMQAALMRISQMRQLAMRAGKPRVDHDGRPASEASGPGRHASADASPAPTLASVFAELEKDIEQLVVGQLGGFLAADREIDSRASSEQDRESGVPGRSRPGRVKANGTEAGSARTGRPRSERPSARDGKDRSRAGAEGSGQRVQLQVAGASAAEVSTGPMAVSGDLGSEEGAAALLADLELLAQQIAGARSSIQAAVNRLQRDATQGDPPPIRTLGARRKGNPSESNPASEQIKTRKSRPEDPIAVVRARLAMAIAAQANASPEAAMRLL
jgi:hypothetical protein